MNLSFGFWRSRFLLPCRTQLVEKALWKAHNWCCAHNRHVLCVKFILCVNFMTKTWKNPTEMWPPTPRIFERLRSVFLGAKWRPTTEVFHARSLLRCYFTKCKVLVPLLLMESIRWKTRSCFTPFLDEHGIAKKKKVETIIIMKKKKKKKHKKNKK